MFRYFLVADQDMPRGDVSYGHWHGIDLGSLGSAGKGWHAVVLQDRHIAPNPKWRPFPKAVDGKTTIKEKVKHTLLADAGLTGDETALEASEKLKLLHPLFEHP